MAISINLYLDTRTGKTANNPDASADQIPSKPEVYSVKIAITKDSSTAYIPTGIKVQADQWKDRTIVKRQDKARLNLFLENMKAQVSSIIYDGREHGYYVNMTATEIKRDIVAKLSGDHVYTKKELFMSLFDAFAEKRKSERTKEIYRVTARKIRSLVPNADKIPIIKIDLDWLEFFDDLLIAKGNKASTRSIDFRNIRAVIRYAKKHKYIQDNPFDDFEIPEGESPDRALTKDQLQALLNADVKPWERKYLDFFFLSFLLRGINTEDLVHLESIENGRINYIRAKTGKPISVKVEPEALEIINRYKGQTYLLNILDTYSRTHNWTAKVDAALKSIANRQGLPNVTMYWSRHTWATLAHLDLGIELSTVADALGHQPEKKVTFVYVKRQDMTKVDEANRKVIDYIL